MPVAAVLLLLCACTAPKRPADNASPLAGARQLVMVRIADWDAATGTLSRLERAGADWRAVADPRPVSIGRAGAAWGIGLHPSQPGAYKREGDGRSPAGVFALGPAFGYASADTTALSYEPMRASHWCIDVPGSPLYNHIVDADEVGADAVAGSSEPMRLDLHAGGDVRYRLGLVIAHNPHNRPGAGSCIFAHVWGAPGQATAGCTAMDATAMRELLDWLDPSARPLLVLLPDAEYARLREPWRLPAPGP